MTKQSPRQPSGSFSAPRPQGAAKAYLRDLPKARLVFYDGGHFVLKERAPEVAHEIIAMFSEAPGGSAHPRRPGRR
jgi:hypothetical protein